MPGERREACRTIEGFWGAPTGQNTPPPTPKLFRVGLEASRRRRRRLHRQGAWRRRRLLGACRRSYAIGSVEPSPLSTRCSPCSIATFSRAQKKPGGQTSQRGSSTRRGGGRHWEHASEVMRSEAWNQLLYPSDARPAQLQPSLARRRSQVGRPPNEVQRKVRRRQEGRSGAIKGTDHPTALPQVPLSAPAIAHPHVRKKRCAVGGMCANSWDLSRSTETGLSSLATDFDGKVPSPTPTPRARGRRLLTRLVYLSARPVSSTVHIVPSGIRSGLCVPPVQSVCIACMHEAMISRSYLNHKSAARVSYRRRTSRLVLSVKIKHRIVASPGVTLDRSAGARQPSPPSQSLSLSPVPLSCCYFKGRSGDLRLRRLASTSLRCAVRPAQYGMARNGL